MTSLVHLTDEELQSDVRSFVETHLPSVKYENLLRAARVAKDIRTYDEVARRKGYGFESSLPVQLTAEEKRALSRERDVPFSEKGMRIVILTVSIAALLQGRNTSLLSSPSPLTPSSRNRLCPIVFQRRFSV